MTYLINLPCLDKARKHLEQVYKTLENIILEKQNIARMICHRIQVFVENIQLFRNQSNIIIRERQNTVK